MSYIFLNNEFVHEDDALISVKDRGFLYGDGIFETLRSYNGYLFNLGKHVDRMKHSADILKIPFNYYHDNIVSSINELLKRNDLLNSYIRITLSRGVGIGDRGFRIPDYKNSQSPIPNPQSSIRNPQSSIPDPQSKVLSSTFIIQVRPLKLYDADLYNHGMSVIISVYRRSTSCPISCHKTSNFLTNIMARDEADLKRAHDVILLNTEGHVAECSASNLFIVEGDTVITPSLDANILPGITRETVLDICKNTSILSKEERFGIKRLMGADECFLTNSIMEIMPVSEINGLKIGSSIPGKQTKYLMRKYKELAENNGK